MAIERKAQAVLEVTDATARFDLLLKAFDISLVWLRFLASDLLGWAKLGRQVHKVNQEKAKFRNINANYDWKHNPEVLVRLQILSVGGSGCCYESCLWLL